MKWYSINFLHIIIIGFGYCSMWKLQLCCHGRHYWKDSCQQGFLWWEGGFGFWNGLKTEIQASRGKNEYTTLSLANESKSAVNVFVRGHSKIKEVQKVKVTGIYRMVKNSILLCSSKGVKNWPLHFFIELIFTCWAEFWAFPVCIHQTIWKRHDTLRVSAVS